MKILSRNRSHPTGGGGDAETASGVDDPLPLTRVRRVSISMPRVTEDLRIAVLGGLHKKGGFEKRGGEDVHGEEIEMVDIPEQQPLLQEHRNQDVKEEEDRQRLQQQQNELLQQQDQQNQQPKTPVVFISNSLINFRTKGSEATHDLARYFPDSIVYQDDSEDEAAPPPQPSQLSAMGRRRSSVTLGTGFSTPSSSYNAGPKKETLPIKPPEEKESIRVSRHHTRRHSGHHRSRASSATSVNIGGARPGVAVDAQGRTTLHPDPHASARPSRESQKRKMKQNVVLSKWYKTVDELMFAPPPGDVPWDVSDLTAMPRELMAKYKFFGRTGRQPLCNLTCTYLPVCPCVHFIQLMIMIIYITYLYNFLPFCPVYYIELMILIIILHMYPPLLHLPPFVNIFLYVLLYILYN
jgi:hypothetical protein